MMHYMLGSDIVTHKGRTIQTIVGNPEADAFVENLTKVEGTSYTKVPTGLENRPDLLANQFYGDPEKLWLVCLASNRFDVFEDFGVNEKIDLL